MPATTEKEEDAATAHDGAWRRAIGRRILSEANDLKRTPAALAADLDWSLESVSEIIEGRAGANQIRQFLIELVDYYPVSLADLWLDRDDTDAGVLVVAAAQSKASARIFDRPDRSGKPTPYYEYRDTAMSRNAPYKPEWISQIRVVDDADPNNPDVIYNNGHLMHQTTFFIGPVNFYWEIEGRRHCAEMNTGDSNYITPFVPHSFACRSPEQRGLIIAVTFAAGVSRAQREFAAIGQEAAEDLAGDLRQGRRFAHRLRRQLSIESLADEDFIARLSDCNVDANRARALMDGSATPVLEELEGIAAVLTVRSEDLLATGMEACEAAIIDHADPAKERPYETIDGSPAYRLRPLARSRLQPLMKGFEVTVLGQGNAPFQHSLHEFSYNFGEAPVRLWWHDDREAILGPGDSAYVRPHVRHGFSCVNERMPGQLVVVRIPGALTDPVIDEFAAFEPERRGRLIAEDRTWF